MPTYKKVRMGMVGGGIGSFIGAVHRMAAALDGKIELVCGAFSSDPEKSLESGRSLGLDDDRIYALEFIRVLVGHGLLKIFQLPSLKTLSLSY